jgi:hypothetical protein
MGDIVVAFVVIVTGGLFVTWLVGRSQFKNTSANPDLNAGSAAANAKAKQVYHWSVEAASFMGHLDTEDSMVAMLGDADRATLKQLLSEYHQL